MGQILVRNLDDAVIARLKEEARRTGRSLEQTVRDLLSAAAGADRSELIAFAAEMRAMTARKSPSLNVVAAIREDRDSDHGHECP
jgi:plasmid stability protein